MLFLNKHKGEDLNAGNDDKIKRSNKEPGSLFLLEKDRGREAFELMLKRAEIADYLPPGRKPVQKPSMILMEDLL